MGAAVLVEIDLAWSDTESDTEGDVAPMERVLRVEGQVVRHDDGDSGFAVMATQTSIEPSSVVLEGLV